MTSYDDEDDDDDVDDDVWALFCHHFTTKQVWILQHSALESLLLYCCVCWEYLLISNIY